jgi:hypothetical protein
MAKSETGKAFASFDGKTHQFFTEGDGIAAVGRGMAIAYAGDDNIAVAYSNRADKASRSIASGSNRGMITNRDSQRCCGGTNACYCERKCRCVCDERNR